MPLQIAARNNDIKITNLLLQHGADVNIKDKHGHTALDFAVFFGSNEVINILLEHGANPINISYAYFQISKSNGYTYHAKCIERIYGPLCP